MKKTVKFLLVAAVAALAVVSCSKPNNTAKPDDNKDNQEQENKDPEPVVEAKLAIDGKFAEWANIDPVGGQDGLLLMKTQVTDDKLYFYLEADEDVLFADNVAFANYFTLVLDCDQGGSDKISYWGGEGGCTYDKILQIWLMQSGKANMANWDNGFAGKAKIEDGVYKGEFSLLRDDGTENPPLKSKKIYFGAYLVDQYVEVIDGEEAWQEGELVGLAPEQGEDLARVK